VNTATPRCQPDSTPTNVMPYTLKRGISISVTAWRLTVSHSRKRREAPLTSHGK
jgi:hypothetical protein